MLSRSARAAIVGAPLAGGAMWLACNGLVGNTDAVFFPDGGNGASDAGFGPDGSPTPACDPAKLASDGKNCGRCGHDCLGDACAGGTCEPVALVLGQSSPQDVAVDDTYLYWTTEELDGGGAQPRLEISPLVEAFAVDRLADLLG